MQKTLLILLLLASLAGYAQVATFDVVMAGHTIGSVKVLPQDDGARLRKRIEAEFSVPFFSGSFVAENQFSEGTLHSSLTEQTVNGKRREQTVTTRLASQHYRFDLSEKTDRNRKWEVVAPIAHTITGLYYQEPAQVQAVYSEKFGAMCKIRKLGNGSYSVELPNGKESVYSYEHGHCVRVVTELAGVKLSIVRKQRPL
ncbi:hypothetical protein J2Y45_003879 [Dyadobacter sp. BE34]|uniref:Uncharacterized protein n=1 Tax=Dyadobacter fermentans TaxID=94254 RepID=A0ABU1R0A4_9BACT|nr:MULTISPECIES: DUF6134 family protein [Dyadobacter]MDR6806687.1 hypothetical protein [Dyadobacter fermentans]MDR7044429.1 hypothetical protein [Dyadobacter sp. BE242]MDR7198739.1 hypothetical protein [Dyadobacter sp. BE34]MDR7216701.1 hypothetical protein [Dyadobacter sp. BE31]MDR7263773.1 hypothetical protein [Dyadobacter sp. BE32]